MNNISPVTIILVLIIFTWSSIYSVNMLWRNPDRLKVLNPWLKEHDFELWLWVYRFFFSLLAIGFIAVWIWILVAIISI